MKLTKDKPFKLCIMKSKKLIQFEQEFNNIDKIKIFEIPVIDKRTNEQEYVIFDIDINNSFLVAQHESLTRSQEKSKKIAHCKIKIDPDFSIDENLQELYSECINAICESDFFELSE